MATKKTTKKTPAKRRSPQRRSSSLVPRGAIKTAMLGSAAFTATQLAPAKLPLPASLQQSPAGMIAVKAGTAIGLGLVARKAIGAADGNAVLIGGLTAVGVDIVGMLLSRVGVSGYIDTEEMAGYIDIEDLGDGSYMLPDGTVVEDYELNGILTA